MRDSKRNRAVMAGISAACAAIAGCATGYTPRAGSGYEHGGGRLLEPGWWLGPEYDTRGYPIWYYAPHSDHHHRRHR